MNQVKKYPLENYVEEGQFQALLAERVGWDMTGYLLSPTHRATGS